MCGRLWGEIRVRWLLLLLAALTCACSSAARMSAAQRGGASPGASGNGTASNSGAPAPGPASTAAPVVTVVTTPPPPPPTAMRASEPIAASLVPMAVDTCPGTIAPDVVTRLRAAGAATSSARWLYPYDRTVFPRKLTAPVLQWELPAGAGATAAYIHLKSTNLDYQACIKLTEAMRVQLPQDAWDLAGAQSAGRADPLTVEVVLDDGKTAQRLAPLTLIFALADLKGAVYYNTYGSLIATQQGIVGGVVMRAHPSGNKPPEVFLSATEAGQCIGCHSVSADGSKLVAEVHEGGGAIEGASRSFDLHATGAGVNPTPLRTDLKRAGFSGIFPDGSVYATTARLTAGPGPVDNPPNGIGNVTGTFGPESSKLFDTMTGAEIKDSGLHPYAFMPTFSVDGSMLVFNSVESATTTEGGHTLAVMDYDRGARKFSNLRAIFNDPKLYPSWPFFLPEVTTSTAELSDKLGRQVVFSLVANNDLLTSAALPAPAPAAGSLYLVDLDSKLATPLDRANGKADGKVYLPNGEAEANLSFVPTVSPVAAGGYFWVFFTSLRSYGNVKVAGGFADSSLKKIWVTAIDVGAPAGTDPSHPAFYFPAQELESGNIRAFAALDPCRPEGTACDTGVDCCCGYCLKASPADAQGQCACQPNRCAQLDEKCKTAADCCDPKASCAGGFCGFPLQ